MSDDINFESGDEELFPIVLHEGELDSMTSIVPAQQGTVALCIPSVVLPNYTPSLADIGISDIAPPRHAPVQQLTPEQIGMMVLDPSRRLELEKYQLALEAQQTAQRLNYWGVSFYFLFSIHLLSLSHTISLQLAQSIEKRSPSLEMQYRFRKLFGSSQEWFCKPLNEESPRGVQDGLIRENLIKSSQITKQLNDLLQSTPCIVQHDAQLAIGDVCTNVFIPTLCDKNPETLGNMITHVDEQMKATNFGVGFGEYLKRLSTISNLVYELANARVTLFNAINEGCKIINEMRDLYEVIQRTNKPISQRKPKAKGFGAI